MLSDKWHLRHVGVVVKDMVKTLDYYRSLGIFEFEPGATPIETRVEIIHGKQLTHVIRSGKLVKLGSLWIELVEPIEGRSLHREFLEEHGEGLQHLSCFEDDFAALKSHLGQKGIPVELTREGVIFGYFDIGKFMIEMVQTPQNLPVMSDASSPWQFAHMGVVVRDVEKTLAHYEKLGIFTIDNKKIETRPHPETLVYGKLTPFTTKAKIIKLGPVNVELVQPVDGVSLQQEYLDKHGEGIQHISFAVADLEKERAALLKKGIKPILTRTDGEGFTWFDIRKEGNVILELVQAI